MKHLHGCGRHGGLDVVAQRLLWQARIPWPSCCGAGVARMQYPAQLPAIWCLPEPESVAAIAEPYMRGTQATTLWLGKLPRLRLRVLLHCAGAAAQQPQHSSSASGRLSAAPSSFAGDPAGSSAANVTASRCSSAVAASLPLLKFVLALDCMAQSGMLMLADGTVHLRCAGDQRIVHLLLQPLCSAGSGGVCCSV